MSQVPHTAMVLAAGYGKRMLPLTEKTPKPLLPVGGKTMLDQVLDRLHADGIGKIVVNAGYLGDQIAAHCAARTDLNIAISREAVPLETGGGVKQALPLLGDDPIFLLNAEPPWRESGTPALQRMRAAWDAAFMDILLLTLPLVEAPSFVKGDFKLEPDGRLHRHDVPAPPDVFISAMIVKPQLYAARPETTFSNNLIFDAAEAAGRLYGLRHDGTAYNVGTPADLARANQLLADNRGWKVRQA